MVTPTARPQTGPSITTTNSKPSNVLKLGYYSRNIDLMELEAALADLADEIQPTVFFALTQAIQQLREHYRICEDERELLAALAPNIGDMPVDLEDQASLIGRLQSFADRVLGPANPYRAWYDLGTALGDFAATTGGLPRYHPEASRIRDAIQALPVACLESVPVLQHFIERDRAGHKPDTLVEEALGAVLNAESCPEDGALTESVANGFLKAVVQSLNQPVRSNPERKDPAATVPTARSGATGRLTGREQEIVNIIQKAGHRLTGKQVLGELDREKGSASPGTTKNYLAALVRREKLTNRQDVEPRGYGLPEWDKPGYIPE
jgi:hypothetical protein